MNTTTSCRVLMRVKMTLFQATSRLLSSRNALASMLTDIPACIRTRISQLSLTLDVLTLLLNIICPKLRPVCKSINSIYLCVCVCV